MHHITRDEAAGCIRYFFPHLPDPRGDRHGLYCPAASTRANFLRLIMRSEFFHRLPFLHKTAAAAQLVESGAGLGSICNHKGKNFTACTRILFDDIPMTHGPALAMLYPDAEALAEAAKAALQAAGEPLRFLRNLREWCTTGVSLPPAVWCDSCVPSVPWLMLQGRPPWRMHRARAG